MFKIPIFHASLMFLSLYTTCCFLAEGKALKSKVAAIGNLKWTIYDNATKTLISSGEKALHPEDIKIRAMKTFYDKQIELSDHFIFSLADGINAHGSACNGFGLTGRRDDQPTFGWDWFEVDREGHATKLQESGELAFDIKTTSVGAEISRMEFLTDVSLRVSPMKQDLDSQKPAWRIKILKGSSIAWPSAGAQCHL
jgi:hypothetical protein